MKHLIIALGLLVAVLPLGAAGEKESAGPAAQTPVEPQSAYPLTLTDDGGTPLTLPAAPQRIVSLTAFTDDVLLELLDARRILAVTVFAQDREISNVAEKIAGIPNRITLNVEVVLSLRPDLVFVANWSEADKVKQLREVGVPVFLLASGLTVREIQEKIQTVARLVGEERKGRELTERMNARLEEVAKKLSGLGEKRRRTVLDYTVWGSAQGKGSSWDEIVGRAGLINAVGDLEADQWGQVPLSKEKLVELDPDILILPGWVYADPQGADAFFRQTVEDPALQNLKAIREKRVYRMPENLKTATSQYIVGAVEYLARTAYPELFPEGKR